MQRNMLVGQRFAQLVVVELAGISAKQNLLWKCMCDCGGTAVSYAYDLRAGKVKSCGCLVRGGNNIAHGYARSGSKRSPLYNVWAAMLRRCAKAKDSHYAAYGGRGITVCKRWLKFENFLADMGERPPGLTLERRDNNKGYSAGNCYWASRAEQARNKRSNVYVVLNGTRMILQDALDIFGASRSAMRYQCKTHGLTNQEVIEKWLQKRAL